jgi:hypothetical protein
MYRGWERHESYWDTPGMNENLKFLGDHVPGLNVVGADTDPLPATAAQGSCVLHLATGEYSVYSVKADNSGSAWTRYPASKGLMAYFDDVVYGNTGSMWKDATSQGTEAFMPVTTPIVPITIDNTTAPGSGTGRVFFSDIDAGGFNTDAGRMSFSADVIFNNYFALNPSGHVAVVLRQDPATQNTAIRGQGAIFGNVSLAPEGTSVVPGFQLEGFAGGTDPQGNRLIPGGASPEALADGKNYKILIESSKSPDGSKYIRGAVYKQVARGYDCVYDSGDVLDTLVGTDMTKTGLFIGHVFGSGSGGWSIGITNAKVTWSAFGQKMTDVLASSGGGGTDSQTLSISGQTLSISGGNSVTLPTSSADGSETKLSAGTNVTITGTGTSGSPYVINSTGTGTGTTQYFQSGTNTTLTGAGTIASKYQYDVATATEGALGVARFATSAEAVAGTGGVISTPSTVNAQIAARYTQANVAVGIASSQKLLMSNPTVRTYAQATLFDTMLDPGAGWGSWQSSEVFRFSEGGAFRFDVNGFLFAEIGNASTNKRVNISAYLVVGGVAYWLGGGISELIEPGNIYPSSGISGSVTLYNVAANDAAYITIASNANPGFTTFNIYWGITGAIQGGGSGASGIIITKV